MIPDAQIASLDWQVVEVAPSGGEWVIGVFNLREDALIFQELAGGRVVHAPGAVIPRVVVRDALAAQLGREVRRPVDVQPAHEGVEP